MKILEEIGVSVDETNALTLFEDAGAHVDFEKKIVRFPEHLVKEGTKKAPKSFKVGARNPKYDLFIGREKTVTRPGSGYTNILDPETKILRKPTQKDVEETAKIMDALDNTSFSATHLQPNDVLPEISDLYAAEIMLRNTEKHILFSPQTATNFNYIAKMAALVQGGSESLEKKPFVSTIASPNSPLRFGRDDALTLMNAAKCGIPILLASSPLCGASGPVTQAGSLALAAAENLASNLLVQLVRPRSRVLYGVRCVPFDMRTELLSFGSIEFALLSAAGVQIAHYYGLPADARGTMTNSKALDEQTGFEKAATEMFPALAGAEVITGSGSVETDNTSSLEQLVIDDEFYAIMFRALRGIQVDEETLAFDVIRNVGPGGHFLTQRHTVNYYRKENYLTRLFDFSTRQRWLGAGGKNIVQVARERVKKILSEHRPAPLERDVIAGLKDILKEAHAGV
jgi:trimethylamine--corrinoid protein Co-methyltransferase